MSHPVQVPRTLSTDTPVQELHAALKKMAATLHPHAKTLIAGDADDKPIVANMKAFLEADPEFKSLEAEVLAGQAGALEVSAWQNALLLCVFPCLLLLRSERLACFTRQRQTGNALFAAATLIAACLWCRSSWCWEGRC